MTDPSHPDLAEQAEARKLADAVFEQRGIPAEGVLVVCVAAGPDGLSVIDVDAREEPEADDEEPVGYP